MEENGMASYAGIKIFMMGEEIREIEPEDFFEKKAEADLFVVTSKNMRRILSATGMNFEGDLNIREVGFSKVETQQECLWGSLYIPNLADVMGSRYRILFFINKSSIIIIDDYDFSRGIINKIRMQRRHQADTREKFFYNFLAGIINRDLMSLAVYEKSLMSMEERVVEKRDEDFQSAVVPIRNELLVLQEYYDELRDLGKELEEDENGFFDRNERKYFGVFSDRADRLMNKSGQLLEYAKQIKDDYQTSITAKQNRTMQFLTIISTIFMPLTLITSWYGMNFENMPELENGYPFVIGLSVCVIAVTLIIFKRKRIL